MRRFTKYAFAAGLVGFLGFLYFRTLAPGITWAYDGADGGDLVTAAVTGGVPHPTGYPTYLLIASAFLRIPFGSLAYRTNALSAVCMIGAAVMLYLIMLRVGTGEPSALIAGVAFGTFPLAWSQAIITEVNALHASFIALMLYFLVVGARHPLGDLAGGLFEGLGIGNHVSMVLALPLLATGHGLETGRTGWELGKLALAEPKSCVRRGVGLVMGLGVYAIIPFRAATAAPVNWGQATGWNGFLWLVSGRLYWDRLAHLDPGYLWTAFRAWSHFLSSQIDIIGLLLLFAALSLVPGRSRLLMATGWLAAIYSVFAILYYSPDSYVYLLPVLVSLAIWIGLGSQWVLEHLPARFGGWRIAVASVLPAMFLIRAVLAIPSMDLSKDHAAEAFAENALHSAPQAAIVLTSGDEATFALWYRHFAYGERPDIALVSDGLLAQAWYRELLTKTDPGLVIPDGPFLVDWGPANPGRAVCTVDLGSGLVCSD